MMSDPGMSTANMDNWIAFHLDLDAMSCANTMQQRLLMHEREVRIRMGGAPAIMARSGYRVLSQDDEDGIIAGLMAFANVCREPALPEPVTFVDIGAGDCVHHGNAANLVLHFGASGLFVDSDERYVEYGKQFYGKYSGTWLRHLAFESEMVTAANVNQLVTKGAVSLRPTMLSIDVDGMDYWLWKALSAIRPTIVVIETRVCWGNVNAVVPYAADWELSKTPVPGYYGASLLAMVSLAKSKDYRLVGVSEAGVNAFFFDALVAASNERRARDLLRMEEAAMASAMSKQVYGSFGLVSHMPFVEG